MIAPPDITAIVLAAGLSHRHGLQDKLLRNLDGIPMAQYIMDTLATILLMERVVVVAEENGALVELVSRHHFKVVGNPDPARGQGYSLSLGVKDAVEQRRPEALLVCLADMPFVSAATVDRLMQALNAGSSAAVCSVKNKTSPPALFRKEHFGSLARLDGDSGAKALLHTIPDLARIDVEAGDLKDFDVEEDFLTG